MDLVEIRAGLTLLRVTMHFNQIFSWVILDSRTPQEFSPIAAATLSNFLLNGAAWTLLVALALVQQGAGLSSLQSGPVTVGYLVAILSTIRVGEKLLQKMGARKPMLMGGALTFSGHSVCRNRVRHDSNI